MYKNNEIMNHSTAFRNSSLQGAYFMMVSRALGLDCGPMSGFNNQLVDEIFFNGTNIKSNFSLLYWLWRFIKNIYETSSFRF